MKNILFITLIIFTSVKCQMIANVITETEFNNIKIKNITLSAIKATQGDETQIRDLIPEIIIESNTDPDGDFFNYTYDGFEIGFSANLGTHEHPVLGGFEITKSNWSFTVQGNTVTIGSNISELGNVVFNTKSDGSKGIIYQYCNGCNNYIGIDFNQSTNRITRIYFIEQT